jgi:hypothetical protein
VSEAESADREPELPERGLQPAVKGTEFLKRGYRDLEGAELATPTAVRFLLAEIDRLNGEVEELRPFRKRCGELDIRVAVLTEKTKSALAFEIMSGACLAIGAAMIGYSRYLWDTPPNGYFSLGFGIALMVGGFVAER